MSHAPTLLVLLTDREHRIRRSAVKLIDIEQGDTRRAANLARGNATQADDPDFWTEVAKWIEAHPQLQEATA